MGLIGARERRVIPAEPELEEKENEREAAKETRVLSRRISYKPRIEERAMVRTLVAAYLDVLCVLNLLSSDASLLSSSVARIKTPATFLPLPSLLEEISPSPLRVPISLPAPAVHISPVGDCRHRHRSLSDRGC